jgi:hypothetical protein
MDLKGAKAMIDEKIEIAEREKTRLEKWISANQAPTEAAEPAGGNA